MSLKGITEAQNCTATPRWAFADGSPAPTPLYAVWYSPYGHHWQDSLQRFTDWFDAVEDAATCTYARIADCDGQNAHSAGKRIPMQLTQPPRARLTPDPGPYRLHYRDATGTPCIASRVTCTKGA